MNRPYPNLLGCGAWHDAGGAVNLITGSRIGPYEIAAPLGAGGMGEVFRAREEWAMS